MADYRGPEISDRIYRAILRQCYQMFRFQNGCFSSCGSEEPNPDKRRELLCQKLLQFYDQHLTNLRDPAQCDIIDMLHSIQYLPLDKTLFLRAQNFGTLCETFPDIKESIMLYQEQVLCGGKLSPEDLHCVHSYVVQHVLKVEASSSTIAVSPSLKRSISECQVGGFVRSRQKVAGDEHDAVNEEDHPMKVYVTLDKEAKPYYLLIYRALHITLCLFLNGMLRIRTK